VCRKDLPGVECAAVLANTDNEFWLADRPNGFQHTVGGHESVLDFASCASLTLH
jgi:hypothetical protein